MPGLSQQPDKSTILTKVLLLAAQTNHASRPSRLLVRPQKYYLGSAHDTAIR
jgi:hypothetical protein